jgi:hypothetical protein
MTPFSRVLSGVFTGLVIVASQSAWAGSIDKIDSSNWNTDPVNYGMTAKEFIQAESRAFFGDFIDRVGVNQWFHFQGLSDKDDRWVVSPNNDTIYSVSSVNVSEGFELVMPDVGADRFLSIQIGDENHVMPFYLFGGGKYSFTPDQFESDFVGVGIRMGTDGTPEDVKYVIETLQPQYQIIGAKNDAEIERPDLEAMLKVRKALIAEYDRLEDTFGVMVEHTSEVTDWEKFTYVTAGALGLSKEEYAMYLPYAKAGVMGGKCYVATYPPVPAKEFFSITAYGQDKYLMSNERNIVSSGQGALINDDGSFTVHFGGPECQVAGQNYLYTPDNNWSFLMRAYRPDVEAFKAYVLPEIEETSRPVTPENYVVAETDWNFAGQQAQAPINTWTHNDQATKDNQTIIRSNADVVYSLALVDVSEGATLSIPKRENGALQLIHYMDENHLTHGVIYAGESVALTPDDLTDGEYIYILARTQISDDMAETKAAQRSMVITANSARSYQSKGFDSAEVVAFRDRLNTEHLSGKAFGDEVLDASRAFGATFDDVDFKDYYYGAAGGWGGLPPQHAQYTPSVNGQGSAAKCQTITFPKPNLEFENGGFFSLTTYDAESWIAEDNFYIGHKRMLENSDGTMTIDFNCDTPYSVTVGEGWNGTFRLYKPVDVNETIDFVNHLLTLSVEMK